MQRWAMRVTAQRLSFPLPTARKMATKDLKRDLRKQTKTRLSQLTNDEVSHQSKLAQELILKLPQYKNAKRLSIYLSMPKSECQTNQILEHALSNDKKVFVPYIHEPPIAKRKTIDMLHLRSLDEFENLERDGWGIPALPLSALDDRENAMGGNGLSDGLSFEPSGAEAGREGGLDLVVVPGVAFDEDMNRLGHGGGFYDGFLTRYYGAGAAKPYLVGLCLAEQMLPVGEKIPTVEHDWILDAVAVGDGRLLTLDAQDV